MPISFDNSSEVVDWNNGTVNSLTVSHTASGDDRLALIHVVGLNWLQTGVPGISSVTYGGSACTLIKTYSDASTYYPAINGGSAIIQLYYIVAPATGPKNVVVSFSSTKSAYVAVSSYAGVSQSAPINQSATNNGAGTISTNITPTVSGCWIVSSAYSADNASLSNAGYETRESNAQDGGTLADSNIWKPKATQAIVWETGVRKAGIIVAAIAPKSFWIPSQSIIL
jgi:hypothetical protein